MASPTLSAAFGDIVESPTDRSSSSVGEIWESQESIATSACANIDILSFTFANLDQYDQDHPVRCYLSHVKHADFCSDLCRCTQSQQVLLCAGSQARGSTIDSRAQGRRNERGRLRVPACFQFCKCRSIPGVRVNAASAVRPWSPSTRDGKRIEVNAKLNDRFGTHFSGW